MNIEKGHWYIDATLGEAGYTNEILKAGGKVLAIDADQEQIDKAKKNLELRIRNEELKVVQGYFGDIERIAKTNNFYPVDAVVFDLGLSMKQLNESDRGFSYKKTTEPLDMRIDTKAHTTAADIVNSRSEKELYEVFVKNAEELGSGAIAHTIVLRRSIKPVRTVGDLVEIVDRVTGGRDMRVLARIFQALRIEVNDEFNQLEKGLNAALTVLSEHGKILVVTFHSLEDRLVKMFGRKHGLSFVPKKPIISEHSHTYERSAKLRVIIT